MDRYICIHGHFYQPPRENPWLEAIELQDSAYPYHDWNERITAECYAPNTASRILNPDRIGGVRDFESDEMFASMRQDIEDIFHKNNIQDLIHAIDKHFLTHRYSLWHLFRDEQRAILDEIFNDTSKEIELSFRQIYERYLPVLQALGERNIHFPRYFYPVIEFILNMDMQRALEDDAIDFELLDRHITELKRWQMQGDRVMQGFIAGRRINEYMTEWQEKYDETTVLEQTIHLLKVAEELSLELNIWKAQNIYFSVGRKVMATMQQKKNEGDAAASTWFELFDQLGHLLKVRI